MNEINTLLDVSLGLDMTKVAIYVQEGGDLRTNIVTS